MLPDSNQHRHDLNVSVIEWKEKKLRIEKTTNYENYGRHDNRLCYYLSLRPLFPLATDVVAVTLKAEKHEWEGYQCITCITIHV